MGDSISGKFSDLLLALALVPRTLDFHGYRLLRTSRRLPAAIPSGLWRCLRWRCSALLAQRSSPRRLVWVPRAATFHRSSARRQWAARWCSSRAARCLRLPNWPAAVRSSPNVSAASESYPNTTDPVERRLLNVVEEMALASGVPVPAVFSSPKSKGINAFAAGYSPSDAVIGVTRGCAQQLNRDQLRASSPTNSATSSTATCGSICGSSACCMAFCSWAWSDASCCESRACGGGSRRNEQGWRTCVSAAGWLGIYDRRFLGLVFRQPH